MWACGPQRLIRGWIVDRAAGRQLPKAKTSAAVMRLDCGHSSRKAAAGAHTSAAVLRVDCGQSS